MHAERATPVALMGYAIDKMRNWSCALPAKR